MSLTTFSSETQAWEKWEKRQYSFQQRPVKQTFERSTSQLTLMFGEKESTVFYNNKEYTPDFLQKFPEHYRSIAVFFKNVNRVVKSKELLNHHPEIQFIAAKTPSGCYELTQVKIFSTADSLEDRVYIETDEIVTLLTKIYSKRSTNPHGLFDKASRQPS